MIYMTPEEQRGFYEQTGFYTYEDYYSFLESREATPEKPTTEDWLKLLGSLADILNTRQTTSGVDPRQIAEIQGLLALAQGKMRGAPAEWLKKYAPWLAVAGLGIAILIVAAAT